MTYAQKLKDPRWQKRRIEVFDRDNVTCQLCKDTTTEVHIHHLKYTGEPWDAPLEDLTTYCKHCHEIVSLNKHSPLNVEKVIKKKLLDKITQIFVFTKGEPVIYLFKYYEQENRLEYLTTITNSVLFTLQEEALKSQNNG